MTNLKEMFNRRETITKNLLDQIVRELEDVLDATQDFIRERAGSDGVVQWEDITYDKDDGLVTIVGMLEFLPGDVIELEDKTITITEQTQEYFKQAFRLDLPYDLVNEGTYDHVTTFLQEAAITHIDATDGDNGGGDNSPPTEVDLSDFDVDSLTEEQKEQLLLFSSIGTSNE